MNDIPAPRSAIDRSLLRGDDYFQSLLEQATEKGLLGEPDVERLRMACLALLTEQTRHYLGGESSSVRVEKAQEIMDSVLYTVGLWLKTYPSPEQALLALRDGSVTEIFQSGRKRIETMLAVTKAIHRKLLSRLLDTPNIFYKATLADGIAGFFKLYNPDYAAQEIHITADYPLYNPSPRLKGIEFIHAYVRGAFCENLFCGFFPPEAIHHLLCGYEKDYGELLFNLYGQVLTAALGCVIAGKDPRGLDITPRGLDELGRAFEDKSERALADAVKKAMAELCDRLQLPPEICRYTAGSLPQIVAAIGRAVRGNDLTSVFYLPATPENEPKIRVSYGKKMDNKLYRRLLAEIRDCRFSDDKLTIIQNEIHSLADLDDLLMDAELTEEETEAVFASLSPPQLAALRRKHNPAADAAESELKESERAVRQRLRDFLAKMAPERQSMIEKAIAAMEEE